MRFFIGLIGIGLGFLLVWKADWIVNNFGRNNWAERHLGTEGGSRLLYKLIGILVIFLAMLHMFGFFETFVLGIFGFLFK
ncbi:MAG: hypothetical protein COU22_00575 [Candidatus Komeilibacteria bacterium CG10_big_fil_rev_8_21_14_0_10_41_13]|uniref:DUF3784 domain-containing protein n=1 Tax=Candidatus Komeilibacteria bacterium CG10_big_fil_rev_8_21_14_0_10_41_13 TaxID=1974476 RepID=A0A2M6WD76_9BACT|nr:MAG: hypothetical protein COU22_00575 [Candidatus Komeilibacteria bacterium CG10_big_fil_rev_8_21_14_0_10_41_13]